MLTNFKTFPQKNKGETMKTLSIFGLLLLVSSISYAGATERPSQSEIAAAGSVNRANIHFRFANNIKPGMATDICYDRSGVPQRDGTLIVVNDTLLECQKSAGGFWWIIGSTKS